MATYNNASQGWQDLEQGYPMTAQRPSPPRPRPMAYGYPSVPSSNSTPYDTGRHPDSYRAGAQTRTSPEAVAPQQARRNPNNGLGGHSEFSARPPPVPLISGPYQPDGRQTRNLQPPDSPPETQSYSSAPSYRSQAYSDSRSDNDQARILQPPNPQLPQERVQDRQRPEDNQAVVPRRRGPHRHLDIFHRGFQHENREQDRYLNPLGGRLCKVYVQAIPSIYTGHKPTDVTWRRNEIKNVAPWMIRLAYWPFSKVPAIDSGRSAKNSFKASFRAARETWGPGDWMKITACWLPACAGLLMLMIVPTNVSGDVHSGGGHYPVPYRFWSYPKTARNYHEDRHKDRAVVIGHRSDFRNSDRLLLPRYMCFLDSKTEQNPTGRLTPKEWMKRTGNKLQPSYIFVSYTGADQFKRPCDAALESIKVDMPWTCKCSQCKTSRADESALHEIAADAGAAAGVAAYWTDKNCMSDKYAEKSEDVYRISDVTRGAEKIVIVVGRSGQDTLPRGVDVMSLLKEWGSRLWTWPEVLLGPSGRDIEVWTRGTPNQKPLRFSKLNFAERVWPEDSDVARQLIDHYESSLTLSRLELVVLALDALKRRVDSGTTKFFPGDLSYALMGLLRQRPKIVRDEELQDSAFQAFARLSLANDSDRLLERLCCILPVARMDSFKDLESYLRHYWTNMDDFWGAKLWDIEPHCQVSGIAEGDTVVLDGARAATITWDRFQRVAITTKSTLTRTLARLFVRFTPIWFIIACALAGISSSTSTSPSYSSFSSISTAGAFSSSGGSTPYLPIAIIAFLIAIPMLLLSPILILHIYGGKIWDAQAWLFGFEGTMPLRDIERRIFGFYCGRLSWAPYSSSLSCHRQNAKFLDDECEGMEPLINCPDEQVGDGLRTFTLVDTYSMTVTTFRATRPPVAALILGSEGGMQRVAMCSYDWATATFYRETILRMETQMLNVTSRVGRVRFGLKRWKT